MQAAERQARGSPRFRLQSSPSHLVLVPHGRCRAADCVGSGLAVSPGVVASLRELAERGAIAEFRAAPARGDASSGLLLVRPPAFISWHGEWSSQMWQSAARYVARLCGDLLDAGLELRRVDPSGIQFYRCEPLLADIGAIGSATAGGMGSMLRGIRQRFVKPLAACARGESTLVRRWARGAGIAAAGASRGAEVSVGSCDAASGFREARSGIRALSEEIDRIELKAEATLWSKYYRPISNGGPPDAKPAAVRAILETLSPRTVVDLACNQGPYAMMAAALGASVAAFDADEPCIDALFAHAVTKRADILPGVMDLLDPSPGLGWNRSWPSARRRLAAECAMALAITHHLHLALGLGLAEVAQMLALWSRRWVVTEFVPLTAAARNPYLGSVGPDIAAGYQLERFCEALAKRFRDVFPVPAEEGSRRLIVCEL